MATKKEYINYISGEVTSGRYSGTMLERVGQVPFMDKTIEGNKSNKSKWDAAMTHCRMWFKEIDEFNVGKKRKCNIGKCKN